MKLIGSFFINIRGQGTFSFFKNFCFIHVFQFYFFINYWILALSYDKNRQFIINSRGNDS